jgi:diphosphomevalonate decarboxylase
MTAGRARAVAHPNIALIKYWGNANSDLRIPINGSISLTLDGLETDTLVAFRADLAQDEVWVDAQRASSSAQARVVRVLDHVRVLAGLDAFAHVESRNSFPPGAGLASSASAFAALAFAATAAAGLALEPEALSRVARLGSGSACRSVWGGYVEWLAGSDHAGSYSLQMAPAEHWDLRDVVAIMSRQPKAVGSSEGHDRAGSSPLQPARVADAPRRLAVCRRAILARDFESLAVLVEQDSDLMHAVMATSSPPLDYSLPSTMALRLAVTAWRAAGVPVAYTQDAGPNLHLLCLPEAVDTVIERVGSFEGVVDTLHARPGGPPRQIEIPDRE